MKPLCVSSCWELPSAEDRHPTLGHAPILVGFPQFNHWLKGEIKACHLTAAENDSEGQTSGRLMPCDYSTASVLPLTQPSCFPLSHGSWLQMLFTINLTAESICQVTWPATMVLCSSYNTLIISRPQLLFTSHRSGFIQRNMCLIQRSLLSCEFKIQNWGFDSWDSMYCWSETSRLTGKKWFPYNSCFVILRWEKAAP